MEMEALAYISSVAYRHLHLQESVDNGLLAIELATVGENPFYELFPRHFTAASLLGMGDLKGARTHASVMGELAGRRNPQRQLASMSLMTIASLSCLEGDWEAAREASDRSLDLSPLNPQLLAPRALLEHQVGETAQGEVYLGRFVEALGQAGPDQTIVSGRASLLIPAIARITGVPDRLEVAEATAMEVTAKQHVAPDTAIGARAGLAMLSVEQTDQTAAAEHYAFLLVRRGTMIWTITSADRLLGLLSQTLGNPGQAAVHFEDALIFCRKAGYRPELAWTCCDYASMLKASVVDDDRANAAALLDEALAISTDLGMPPLMKKAAALRESLMVRPTPIVKYSSNMTERQCEVLRLLAQGKTNREIAQALVLSERTVQRHVANIYDRIGARNRSEATAFSLSQPPGC